MTTLLLDPPAQSEETASTREPSLAGWLRIIRAE